MKRDAIAEWSSAGRPLTVAEMLEPLPSNATNFAVLPIFITAKREYAEISDFLSEPPSGSLRRRMEEMGKVSDGDGFRPKYFRSERNQEPDFSSWAELNGGEKTAAELLGNFDEKYRGILEELREGLDRPYTVATRWHELAKDSDALFGRGQPITTLAKIVPGLALRAELALEAERPEVCLDSLKMACRVADLVAAENLFNGALAQVTCWSTLRPVLARGLDKEVWTEQQIQELRGVIAMGDERLSVRAILDLETLAMIGSFTGYRKDRKRMAGIFEGYSRFAFTVAKTPLLRECVPAGWYDAFLARVIRMNLAQIQAFERSENLLEWCEASAALDANEAARGEFSRAILPDNDMGTHPRTLRERISYAMVKRVQCLLACDLAIFRKSKGRYPATLDELASSYDIDPMNGKLFYYRLSDDGFVFYSVGVNGTDDGGDKGDDRRSHWNAPDWVW